MAIRLHKLAPLALLTLFACDTQSQPIAGLHTPSFMASEWSEWSPPVNLGPVVNSPSAENHPALSKDGLSLYFTSDRANGLGLTDIWVVRRACDDCPWEAPMNLGAGAGINTASVDAGADVSNDGHYLFFFSNRPGGAGGNDLYVSYRSNVHDDLAWEAPQHLGPEVNTADDENAPTFRQNELYYTRGSNALALQDLYVAPAHRDGQITGIGVAIAELNHPGANDAAPVVRTDGREIMFQRSGQAGGFGNADFWVSTRQGNAPWATPVNVGPIINSPAFEQQANLSYDGRTLLWASNRPNGVGGFDIWMSTRTRAGH